MNLALEAHGLAPNLVPAAAIAGRLLASRGNTPRATKILQRTWSRSPHPDLATAYAYARIGDSPRDRLDRVRQLAALSPNSIEGPIAVATAAIEARQFDEARAALEPLLPSRMTQRVATLMARIEGEQHADKGRVREWLARAVNAPRDPAWTADGFVADRWMPVSPVSGALDAFQWRVPVEAVEKSEGDVLASKLEELVALGMARPDVEPDEEPAPVDPARPRRGQTRARACCREGSGAARRAGDAGGRGAQGGDGEAGLGPQHRQVDGKRAAEPPRRRRRPRTRPTEATANPSRGKKPSRPTRASSCRRTRPTTRAPKRVEPEDVRPSPCVRSAPER